MTLAATSAQAQETVNICDRTQQVQDVILFFTPTNDACGRVLVSEMANIPAFHALHGNGSLVGTNIESLKSGDFDGLDQISRIYLNFNQLTELPSGLFSGLLNLEEIIFQDNPLENLHSGIFSNLPQLKELDFDNGRLSMLPSDLFSGFPKLEVIKLTNNDLSTLPPGIFSGLTSITRLHLSDNPGAPFRFTLRFDPATLDEDFTTASVKLTLREGAPRAITAPLGVVGAALSADSLSLARGDTESPAVTVTRDTEGGHFALIQRRPELGGRDDRYRGFAIVRGPSIVIDAPTVRVRVFLEGALE